MSKKAQTPNPQLAELSALLHKSLQATPAPAPRRIPTPKTWKGWTALGVLAMAAIGALSPNQAPETTNLVSPVAVTASAAPTVHHCVTEDEEGPCEWNGTVRTFDSRSEAEKAAPKATKTVRVTVTAKPKGPAVVRIKRSVPAASATRLHCTETLTIEDGYAFCEG